MRALLGRIVGALTRAPAPEDAPDVRLDDVRRRLELLLAALYGHVIPVAAAEPPRGFRSLKTLLRRAPPHLRPADILSSTDGERILLPATLSGADAGEVAARYRVLAVGQAERLARGTAAYAPGVATPLERDLYLLLESAAVDRAIVRAAPGLGPALAAERAAALARRPPPGVLTPAEREVEEVVRRILSAPPDEPPPELALPDTPAGSLARAREMAARMAAGGKAYRGIPAVAAWGTVAVRPGLMVAGKATPSPESPPSRSATAAGEGETRPAQGDEQGAEDPGGRAEEGKDEPGPDEDGAPRGSGASGAGGGEGEDGEVTGAGGERDDGAPDEQPAADGPVRKGVQGGERVETAKYPEWDWRAGRYLPNAATVHHAGAEEGDGEWAAEVLRLHGATVRRLREKFERLRARRLRLSRQRDGDELDLAACVAALADVRAGLPVDDRLYSATRPARRGLAILLLVDISGSTSEEVESKVRIIDMEKVALLIASQALDALGDPYAVLTFSGRGPHGVRMRTLKDFAERNGETVRRRVEVLQPEGFTRLGAAVRHATTRLARTEAGHRLLIVISDGRPNDEDQYEGRYGVEDSRQAVAEARRAGIFPFCLTVDRSASAYLPRIFGTAGHEIVRRPAQLSRALSRLVEHLLRK